MSIKDDELEQQDGSEASDSDAPEGADESEAPDVAEGADAGGGDGGGGDTPPAELPAAAPPPDPVRDRLWLPLALPLLAMAAIAVYVINLSRVFLAGGNGAASVVAGSIVTVVILIGAAVISASPRLRSSTLTMTVAFLLVIVVSAGLITLGPSEGHENGEGSGFAEPAGPPTAALEVDALPSLKFQSDQFTVPGGILEITYVDRGGSHTLVFEEPEFEGFELAVPGGPTKGKVEIGEGEYTIYCNIPGHRAAGMEAALAVTPGAPPPEGAPPGESAPPGS
jgi:plastocyanin